MDTLSLKGIAASGGSVIVSASNFDVLSLKGIAASGKNTGAQLIIRDAKKLGYGEGYKYPHDYPGGWVEQDYLPKEMEGSVYYSPKDIGYEARFKERLDYIRAQRNKARNKK